MPADQIVRPVGLWVGDRFEFGLEVELTDGIPSAWRSTSSPPDDGWLSPAFANAHSHLEYQGLMGQVAGDEYWPWIRELTRLKSGQDLEEVKAACRQAARENHDGGVALIAEHSDRPFGAQAISGSGIEGWIFQELITFFEPQNNEAKWHAASERARGQATFDGLQSRVNPHATWTVDRGSLERFADQDAVSIHVAEHPVELEFFAHGTGPIAELARAHGLPVPRGVDVVNLLRDVGLMRSGVQWVHLGAIDPARYDEIAESGVAVAHCPRSNRALDCPLPDVNALLDRGVAVGLGLDSAASSGPIDMFAEMRAMNREVSAERRWAMATSLGAASIGYEKWGTLDDSVAWRRGLPAREAEATWILIENPSANLDDLIHSATRAQVRRL